MDDIITLEQAADRWSYNPGYLREIARDGKIPALKCGRKWLFNIKEVETFFKTKALKQIKPKTNVELPGGESDERIDNQTT